MDEVTKCVIRLTHWLDHNIEHLKGYEEVAARLTENGMTVAAQKVQEAITLVLQANDLFSQALAELRKEVPEALPSHGPVHSHPHEHKHTHEHTHQHEHPHTHDGLGEHTHEHDHDHPAHHHDSHDHVHTHSPGGEKK
ncbi:MAG: hypothetical protein ACPL7J_14535 [Desulfomonilaceae bacterium]